MRINEVPPGSVFKVAGEQLAYRMHADRSVSASVPGSLGVQWRALEAMEVFRGSECEVMATLPYHYHPSLWGVDAIRTAVAECQQQLSGTT